jgi:hypothetical protein
MMGRLFWRLLRPPARRADPGYHTAQGVKEGVDCLLGHGLSLKECAPIGRRGKKSRWKEAKAMTVARPSDSFRGLKTGPRPTVRPQGLPTGVASVRSGVQGPIR